MIRIKAVRLINWYGFANMTAPIGSFTLIAGKNGNGKSVLLDAIKYGLYGDTVFNKSTENKGSRTVSSYTRGLLDATAGTYMRPVESSPNVYTHIVLELEEVELKRHFILGTVIDTDSGNGFKTQRYILDNTKLADIEHTYEKEGSIYAYSAVELQRKYGLKMMDVRDGLGSFLKRTGLNLNEYQLGSFRRKLRSIMSYDPNAKIDQFIRESVLEEKKVDLSKLVAAKHNIDVLNMRLQDIEKEIIALTEIIDLFDDVNRIHSSLLVDDIKQVYKIYLDESKRVDEAMTEKEVARRKIATNEFRLTELETMAKEIRLVYDEARLNLHNSNIHQAIQDSEQALVQAQVKEQEVLQAKKALEAFQERVVAIIDWLHDKGRTGVQMNVLQDLTDTTVDTTAKSLAVEALQTSLQTYRDELLQEVTRLQDRSRDNENRQARLRKIIDDCLAKKTTFDRIPDYVGLKVDINREFQNKGIQAEARFACEYVVALTDEKWRNTIEGYLGHRRYTILVPPEYYDLADDVLNESNYKHAHLFNTKLLMKKDIRIVDDSVVQYLDIKNEVARTYFNYQLGRFHAVDEQEVRHYENALAVTGRVSVAMDSFFLDVKRIQFYCLGQESIELNKLRAEKELVQLCKEYKLLQTNIQELEDSKNYIERQSQFFGVYVYDAVAQYETAVADVTKRTQELKDLKLAQQQDSAYWELVTKVSKLEAELQEISDTSKQLTQKNADLQADFKMADRIYEEAQQRVVHTQQKLSNYELNYIEEYKRARSEYDQFILNGETSKGGILKDRARAERKLKQQQGALTEAQATYNAKLTTEKRLPVNDSKEASAVYAKRKNHIWIDDLQEIRDELQRQTKRYEDVFKNEFVLTILKSCEQAMRDLKLINAELKQLEFKSKYAFEVKFVKDGSKFQEILEYAKFLQEREQLGIAWNTSGQLSFDTMVNQTDEEGAALECKMQDLISSIVNGQEAGQIERFADYRNYMTYEILLSNDVLQKAKLSRQSGYNSGAEVQIPYMLILLSALLMIYNDKVNSTRLIFIDEPFAKMDPINVKTMLGFMRKQKLQMIFCAPDKTELIGSACEVILPVLRTQPDLIQIGSVEMHELLVV